MNKTKRNFIKILILSIVLLVIPQVTSAHEKEAYLQITLQIASKDRAAAAEVYKKYKKPFLTKIKGALSKELLIRDEDVQVLHKFDSKENAEAYLKSSLFTKDVVTELKPYLTADPEVRIYFAP